MNLAIYIHWPFCESKCPYCDFNSHVRDAIDQERWLNAYLKEIEFFSGYIQGKNITSIFFGGGTPSLMPPKITEAIITKLSSLANFTNNIEITLEANPGSFEVAKFHDFKKAGINRVSIGIQALNQEDLQFLGRKHSLTEALYAIEEAGKIYNNYSFDLIYARPNQTERMWQKELEYALSFGTKHLSLYQLTIEKGTKFYTEFKKNIFTMPSEDLAASLYTLTGELTAKNGLIAYEVSNYAKSGFESRHNLTYWNYNEYLGIGAGAHSRINNAAIMMTHSPEAWISKVEQEGSGIQTQTKLTEKEICEERLMMGLRLKEGMDMANLDFTLLNQHKYQTFLDNKVLEVKNNKLRICDDYVLLTNKIILDLTIS